MASNVNIPVHPDISKHMDKYERIRVLLESDESKYTDKTFCLQLPNEPDNAYKSRKPLFATSFRNITHDLLAAPRDAIFKEPIRLDFEGEEKNPLWIWQQDVTRGGDELPLLQYVKDVCTVNLRAYGMVWLVVDKPDYQAKNFEQELKEGKPYICNISPQNVVNWQFEGGEMLWFAYKYKYTPTWNDPTTKKEDMVEQLRIWTRDKFYITVNGEIQEVFEHNFGFVPVVYQAFFLPTDYKTIVGIAPFFTTSNLIIFANNLKSVSWMELFKHGNSVLLAHEEALSSMNQQVDTDGNPKTKMQDASGFNMFVWHGEHKPEYLTKDLDSVDKSNDEADDYFLAAVDNERAMRSILKKGVSGHDVAESGVAKMVDMLPITAGLRATAEDLQEITIKILNMVNKLYRIEAEFTCEFPKRFDIGAKQYEQRLNEIEKMLKNNYPSEIGLKESWKNLTPEITQNTDKQNEINKEIEAADLGFNEEKRIQEEVDKELNAFVQREADMESEMEDEAEKEES